MYSLLPPICLFKYLSLKWAHILESWRTFYVPLVSIKNSISMMKSLMNVIRGLPICFTRQLSLVFIDKTLVDCYYVRFGSDILYIAGMHVHIWHTWCSSLAQLSVYWSLGLCGDLFLSLRRFHFQEKSMRYTVVLVSTFYASYTAHYDIVNSFSNVAWCFRIRMYICPNEDKYEA